MNLLISNDDGVFAQGIRTLANTLAAAGHSITVVCPDRERSATGHGLTIHQPIRAEIVESGFHPSIKAWACSGTPADCVKLALGALVEEPPNFVLSGINHGPNLGTDVLYSGTVSAAMEGVIEGIPAIALSLGSYVHQDFLPAAHVAQALLAHFSQTPLTVPLLLNVNVPAAKASHLRGIQITRQGIRRYHDLFEKRLDPRGKTYYWLAGEVLEDVEDPIGNQGWSEETAQALRPVSTDVQAVKENYISITPLQYNLTSLAGLPQLQTAIADPAKLFSSFVHNV
ncbi:5'/3'-nucleotidase SurE [Pseudanabaena sp. FACHB-2040]|uniref:5'/3'-nucleotidase SurE n=1 Tax=Pseudanabaena sp. FACHB-2040 TaxID=2692859 RepID=UPI00168367BE|nr:5'/3'-nucleotidase SurE [Pseudanabaena sp. FACHB-2040]MBD2257361.1 5'/3'-nucleotidase SurE [Pseudanabaena sp. FACHB-2040]